MRPCWPLSAVVSLVLLAQFASGQTSEPRIWKSYSGKEMEAVLVGFENKQLQVWKKFGKVYIDGIEYAKLDADTKAATDIILAENGITVPQDQIRWSKPKRMAYPVAKIVGTKDGKTLVIPMCLFSPPDLAILTAEYAAWCKEQEQLKQQRAIAGEIARNTAAVKTADENARMRSQVDKAMGRGGGCPICGEPLTDTNRTEKVDGYRVNVMTCPRGHKSYSR